MYTEKRDHNNELVCYIRNKDSANIPIDPGNRDYVEVLEWINEGNTPDPDNSVLEKVRQEKIEEIKIEGVRRISLHVPGWDSLDKVLFLVSIWNMLDTVSLTTQQSSARDIYFFVVDTAVPSVQAMSDISQIKAIDVVNHPGWPF